MLDRDAVEALFFDLDGTLMDTDDQTVEKIALRLQRWHVPRPYRLARRLLMLAETPANAFLTVLDVFGLDAVLMKLTDRLRRLRGLSTQPDFWIIDGVEEMLATLDGQYQLGVVTTRGRRDAEGFLRQHDLGHYFEVVVTRESTWRLKPHPAPIRHAAQRLGVPVDRCAMVGDTTVDVKSARRAGAWAVAVLCGFGERKELERSGAHVVLEHIARLPAVLQGGR